MNRRDVLTSIASVALTTLTPVALSTGFPRYMTDDAGVVPAKILADSISVENLCADVILCAKGVLHEDGSVKWFGHQGGNKWLADDGTVYYDNRAQINKEQDNG